MKAVIFDRKDNVATAVAELRSGDVLELKVSNKKIVVRLTAPIPFGHKLSVKKIASGSPVVKYGETIGIATADIEPGDYVHVHNLASTRGRGDLAGGSK